MPGEAERRGALFPPGEQADSHCSPRQNGGSLFWSILQGVGGLEAQGTSAPGVLRSSAWGVRAEALWVPRGWLGRGSGDDAVELVPCPLNLSQPRPWPPCCLETEEQLVWEELKQFSKQKAEADSPSPGPLL